MRYIPTHLSHEDMKQFHRPPMPSSYRDGLGGYYYRCGICARLYSVGWWHRFFRGHWPVEGLEYPHFCTEYCADDCEIKDVCYVTSK